MPKRPKPSFHNEWSFYYNADRVDSSPISTKIKADAKQCEDVAVRANVVSIESLEAEVTMHREQAGRVVHVYGTLNASVTLECSITAEEFDFTVEEEIEGWFEDKESTVSFMKALKNRESKGSQGGKGPVEVEMAPENEDPDAMVEGQIDLGELAVQHLILAIPPYPKKDGAAYEYSDEAIKPAPDSPLKKNPFEALKDWKEKR